MGPARDPLLELVCALFETNVLRQPELNAGPRPRMVEQEAWRQCSFVSVHVGPLDPSPTAPSSSHAPEAFAEALHAETGSLPGIQAELINPGPFRPVNDCRWNLETLYDQVAPLH